MAAILQSHPHRSFLIFEARQESNGSRTLLIHSGEATLEIRNITEGYLPIAISKAQECIKEFLFGFMDACAEDANPVADILLPLVPQEVEDEEATRQAEGSGSGQ
jgi:hypothetical protein